MSRSLDLEALSEEAARGVRPRHAMKQLAQRLGATVHMPGKETTGFAGKLLAKLVGSPELWAFARRIARDFTSQDVIYCLDEAVGLPLAAICSRKRDRPRVAVMVHNVDRPRSRAALRLHAGFRGADAFLAVSKRQLDFLVDRIGIERSRAYFVADQTDLDFFKPGPPSSPRLRPLLVGAGLEKRDYRVFAQAAADLDVDVAVTGFSADSAAGTSLFPEVWPANFERRRYEWTELADLYRNATAVVVTLRPNNYAAGITTMVEGMASGRPIIVTRTEGLAGYLDDGDALTLVPPEDPLTLRDAITALVASPEDGAERGRRAVGIARERYGSEVHVENVAGILERLGRR